MFHPLFNYKTCRKGFCYENLKMIFLPVGTAANPAALATAVGVLTEVPVLLLIKFTNKTRGKFPL